ncbi:MAG: nitroreductase family protein [Candidatus Bipolaricaulaceae bacterium]
MDLWQAITGRRSVRKFLGRPIERPQLERLVEAAVWAPSGGNAQSWRFVAVTEPERVRRIKTVSPGMLGTPAAVIAVCQDLTAARSKGSRLGEEYLAPLDAAMAAQNIMLAAHADGLGTCAVGSFHRGAVSRLLELPDGVEAVLLISVGWPAVEPAPPPRTLAGVLHYERYHGR